MSKQKATRQASPLAVRMSDENKEQLQRLAEIRNTNRNALINYLIAQELEAAKASQELDARCSA